MKGKVRHGRKSAVLICMLAAFLWIEWGPLTDERSKWGISSGDPFVKEVVLTFDDGPREHGTQELVAAMDSLDIKATFFLVGKFAERYSANTVHIAEFGHELANHTFTHPKLFTLWPEKIMREAERCDEVLESLNLPKTRFLRPPGGTMTLNIFNAMRRKNIKLGMWDVNSADYTGRPVEEIVRLVSRSVKPGSIVLMHSGVPNTVEALPAIAKALREQGYTFVRLNDLWNGGKA